MIMPTWRTLGPWLNVTPLLLAVFVGTSSVAALAASPYAYVITGGTVSVIDTTTEAVVGAIATGATPRGERAGVEPAKHAFRYCRGPRSQ